MSVPAPSGGFTPAQRVLLDSVASELPTKAAKMRALEAIGYRRGVIAAYLETSYQHVRNVLGPRLPKPVITGIAQEALSKGDRSWGSVKVGDDGELRLPAHVMNMLEASKGRSLGWCLDGDVVTIMSRDAGLLFVQEMAANFSAADEELASEQFLKERRAEAVFEDLKDDLMYG